MVGISVDNTGRNAAMVDKLILPFPLLSDPEGVVIRQYGIWDEKGEIARPAIFVIGRDKRVLFSFIGEDLADRPGDSELLAALKN